MRLLLLAVLLCSSCNRTPAPKVEAVKAPPPAPPPAQAEPNSKETPTRVVMHNVVLHEEGGFNLRVRWLKGYLQPTKKGTPPSFDDRSSFVLNIDSGVVGVKLSELTPAVNDLLLKGSPLKDVSLTPSGQQLKLRGSLHKGVHLPVELLCDIGASPDGRILMHVAKIKVLKIPMKGLLKVFNVSPADLVDSTGAKGVEIQGDNLLFDPEQILPNPRKRGKLSKVFLKQGEIVQIYGAARPDVVRTRQWRNFLRLSGGELQLGKLTMNHVDIFMIDVSQGDYFHFDMARYQEQMVNGYTRITPEAGLRIFMPDLTKIPQNKQNAAINLQWMKNRNVSPPDEIVP